MTDFYSLLGVSDSASTAEIKRAFRKLAFDHHPDHHAHKRKNSADHAQQHHPSIQKDTFQKILAAYETLRDPIKRAQYDAFRASGNTGVGGTTSSSSPYTWSAPGGRRGGPTPNPTMEDWERQFEEWIRRTMGGSGTGPSPSDSSSRREREWAERRARAEAWAREKVEAAEVKERRHRIRKRAEHAKHQRHAAVLRRFWHTRSGVTWQDGVVVATFLFMSTGLAWHWKRSLYVRNAEREQEEVGVVA